MKDYIKIGVELGLISFDKNIRQVDFSKNRCICCNAVF